MDYETTVRNTILKNIVVRNGKKHGHQLKQMSIQEDCNIQYTYYSIVLVVLAVENSRKPLLLVTYRHVVFLYFHFQLKSKKEKNNEKEKFYTLFINMTWSIEIKCNTIFA